MKSPPRLVEAGRHPLVRELLAAGRAELPSSSSRRRALSAAAALGSGALATTLSSSVGAAPAVWSASLIAKWVGLGLVIGAAVTSSADLTWTQLQAAPQGEPGQQSSRRSEVHRLGRTVAPLTQGPPGHQPQESPLAAQAFPASPPQDLAAPRKPTSTLPLPDPASLRNDSARAVREEGPHAAVFEDAPSLAPEIRLLDQARRSLAAKNGAEALRLLSTYRSQFPQGHFQPECDALAVEARTVMGDGPGAQTLGQEFLRRHPNSPLAERVRTLSETPGKSAGRN